MKKNTLYLVVLCLFALQTQAQSKTNNTSPNTTALNPDVNKTELTNSNELIVFTSQKEKDANIQRLENAIKTRLSKGKTKEELKPLYIKLKLNKNAKIGQYEK